jgi:hypothetical protein
MDVLFGYEFAVGLAVGKILVAATLASRIFRGLALVGAASGLVFVYSQTGIEGLLKLGLTLRGDALVHPEFGYGMAVGALVAAMVGLALRRKRGL